MERLYLTATRPFIFKLEILFTKFGVYFKIIYLCFAFVHISAAFNKDVSQCLFHFFFIFLRYLI